MPFSPLSRNNHDTSLPKGGFGLRNWGPLEDKLELEAGVECGEELETGGGLQAQNRGHRAHSGGRRGRATNKSNGESD